MTNGGNAQAQELFGKLQLGDLPMEEKYKSKGAEWNRQKVRSRDDSWWP